MSVPGGLEHLMTFARTISNQSFGFIPYCPPFWAQPTRCFANAIYQAEKRGGTAQFGWMFQYKTKGYLIAINHAVWRAPNGHLVDVTPFHQDAINHPINQTGSVFFLSDDNAMPDLVPLPSKFYPLSSDEILVEYVTELAQRDEKHFRLAYSEAVLKSSGKSHLPNQSK